jgi:hypothetical protein
MKDLDVRGLSDKEKEVAFKAIGKQLDALEERHGEAVVRWAFNLRHSQRVEKRKLEAERKELEARLSELEKATA